MPTMPYWCCCYPCGWTPLISSEANMCGIPSSQYPNAWACSIVAAPTANIVYKHPVTQVVLWTWPCFSSISYMTSLVRGNNVGSVWSNPPPLFFGGNNLLACVVDAPLMTFEVADGMPGGGSYIGAWRGSGTLSLVFGSPQLSHGGATFRRWNKAAGPWPVPIGTQMPSIGVISGGSVNHCPIEGPYDAGITSNACGSGSTFIGNLS